jgi:anti-anti-sigma factor
MSTRMMINDYAGVTVVTFTDTSLLEAAQIEQIARELYHLADQQNKQKIILDFSKVKTMSSQGIGVLLNLSKKLAGIKGALALCAVRPEIKKIFSITGLDKQFAFHPDDRSALSAWKVNVT